MPVFDVGRVCIKIRGREAGRRCVIVDVLDKNFVLITGPKKLTGVRRRRCNINHLKPESYVLKIPKGASDEQVEEEIAKTEIKDLFAP